MNKIILTALLAAAMFAGCQNQRAEESGGSTEPSAVVTAGQDEENLERTDIGNGFTLILYEEAGTEFQVLESELVRLFRTEGEDRIQVEYGEKNFWVDCPLDFGAKIQPVRILLGDLTGRGSVELSLTGIVAEGTGVHMEDICLIDLTAERKIAIEPLIEEGFTCPFLEERAEQLFDSQSDRDAKASEVDWSKLLYGAWLTYDWNEDGSLTATVSAEAGEEGIPGLGAYVGDFVVTYRLDGECMMPEGEVIWAPET